MTYLLFILQHLFYKLYQLVYLVNYLILVQKFLTVTKKNWGKNDWYGHDKSMYDNIK